jgi:hypothetical protein
MMIKLPIFLRHFKIFQKLLMLSQIIHLLSTPYSLGIRNRLQVALSIHIKVYTLPDKMLLQIKQSEGK